MKSKSIILALACLSGALLLTGCMNRPIEAASTSLEVSTTMGKSVKVSLPKNLDATKLDVTINPQTGEYHLKADKLVTDASTVIDSAAAAQSQALANLSATLSNLLPLLLPQAPPSAALKPN